MRLGGDRSALSSNLKKGIGTRSNMMGAPEAVKETTGYVIDSTPPSAGNLPDFSRSSRYRFKPSRCWGPELLRATQAKLAESSSPSRPIINEQRQL